MLNTEKPNQIDFRKTNNEGRINNMDELLQKKQKERDNILNIPKNKDEVLKVNDWIKNSKKVSFNENNHKLNIGSNLNNDNLIETIDNENLETNNFNETNNIIVNNFLEEESYDNISDVNSDLNTDNISNVNSDLNTDNINIDDELESIIIMQNNILEKIVNLKKILKKNNSN